MCRPSGTLTLFFGYRGLPSPATDCTVALPPHSAQTPRCSGTPASRLQDRVEDVVNGLGCRGAPMGSFLRAHIGAGRETNKRRVNRALASNEGSDMHRPTI